MKTIKLAALALSGLACLAFSGVKAEAGIIVMKNGTVFIGRIDLEDVKKETGKDGKEFLVSVTMHDPRPYPGAPKTPGKMEVPLHEIRWWDREANEPTDDYLKDHLNEVIDQRYNVYIERYRDRMNSAPIVEDPIPFNPSRFGHSLSPIPTPGEGYSIRKPVGWKSTIANDILIFESTEKGVDDVTPRIQCFSVDGKDLKTYSEQLKWIKEELKRLANGDAFEIKDGENATPKSTKSGGYDVEWTTLTRRSIPKPRTIMALRSMHFRTNRMYFVTCYAHEKDFDANMLLYRACVKSLEIDEDSPTGPGSPDAIDTSSVKIGQQYRWKSSSVPDQVVWEIASCERSTVAHKTTTANPDGTKKTTDDVEQIGPFDPVARIVKETGQAGANPQKTTAAPVVVNGITFDCNVYEVDANGKKYRFWLSKKFPIDIKLTIDGNIERELDEVKDAPPK